MSAPLPSIDPISDEYLSCWNSLRTALSNQDDEQISKYAECCLKIVLNKNIQSKYWDYFHGLLSERTASHSIRKQFYENKIIIHSCYKDQVYDGINLNNWESLLKESQSLNDTTLLLYISNLYAVYLELTEKDLNRSLLQYQFTIDYSSKKNKEFSHFSYSAYCNSGIILQNQGLYDLAINNYKKGREVHNNSNRTYENLLRLNNWISECYYKMNVIDSAYLYSKVSQNILKEAQFTKQNAAIAELQEKYQNEKLSNELTQESLKRNQLYLTSLSLGSLLGISLLGIWGIRRFNRLKRKSLEQDIRDTEQRGQLAAINAQLDGESEERKKVAMVLHDGISSHLTAASFHLQMITDKASNKNQESIRKAFKLLNEAAERSRNLSHDLYPPVLVKHGLIPSLQALVESYSNSNIRFDLEAESLVKVLSTEIESKLYFVINELYNNVLKHSQADSCNTTITETDASLSVRITDDGIGIQGDTLGQGIQTIKARIENIQGSVVFNSLEPTGTEVILIIPLDLEEPSDNSSSL